MRRKISKLLKPSEIINKKIILFFIIIVIVYIWIYFRYIYPLHNLSKYQSKEWIKTLTENLILGVNDPSKLYKIRQYEKNIISFWYGYWHFHTEQYTIWGIIHLNNKFSKKGKIGIYYYDFINKEKKQSFLEIDFSKVKTSKINEKLIIRYENNYVQEIDMTNDKMSIRIDTNQIILKLNLTIDDYSTTVASLMPRYSLLTSIADMTETKCLNEWASDNPIIGKINNGQLNSGNIESGGNFWFDQFIGVNNYFLNENTWFCLLNDEWLMYILIFDKKKRLKLKKTDLLTVLYIKDRKNNKILTCGIATNKIKAFHTLDHLIQPKTLDINYRAIDDFDIHCEMPNFKVDMISKPNESSQKSKTIIDNYYSTPDMNIELLSDWDKKYYNTINNFTYPEIVTIANINIIYNNIHTNFDERVVVDGFEQLDKTKPSEIYCKTNSHIRDILLS